MNSNKNWLEKGSKTSLLSEVADTLIENNIKVYDNQIPINRYNQFENYIDSKIQESKTKLKNNIHVIKKTSSWNNERKKIFLNYLEETLNTGTHILSEK